MTDIFDMLDANLEDGCGIPSPDRIGARKTADFDYVNRPPHYNAASIETIDAIREALGDEGFKCFCRGNALKYVWRAPLKGNFKSDMAKAAWYCRMAAGDDPRKDT